MNDLDETTFERFAKRFARIERHVPDPPAARGAAAVPRIRRRRPAIVALAGVTVLLSVAGALSLIGSQTGPRPTATAGAVVPPDTTAAVSTRPIATRPTRGELQHAHPLLGGTGFAITELHGSQLAEPARLSFSGGPTGGVASGSVSSDCSFISFDYAFDPEGSAIAFFVSGDDEGSYTDGCSEAGLAQYAAIAAALPRVADWRKPQADQIELFEGDGGILLEGGRLPPLPMPQVDGDCGGVPIDRCQRAVALAFNFGLFPASGQTVVGWRVEAARYTSCATQGVEPKYDVIFELANPADEWSATVGEMFGVLHACGLY